MNLLQFYVDHKKFFPTLLLICRKEAARKVVEVVVNNSSPSLGMYLPPAVPGLV